MDRDLRDVVHAYQPGIVYVRSRRWGAAGCCEGTGAWWAAVPGEPDRLVCLTRRRCVSWCHPQVIRAKKDELAKAMGKSKRVGFDEDTERRRKAEIAEVTEEISCLFKRCEKNIQVHSAF